MTLRGLIPLVKQCPRLKMLGIPMHVRPVDPALLDGVYNSRLTDFFSLHSTIHSPTQVFRSLIRMFPNLKWVGYGSDPEYGRSWEEVRRLLDDSAFTGTLGTWSTNCTVLVNNELIFCTCRRIVIPGKIQGHCIGA